MVAFIREKSRDFYYELLYPRHFRILIVIYITLKVTGNVFYGASYWTGLRSGVMGILMYWLGMYLINLASINQEELPDSLKLNSVQARRGMTASVLYLAFLFVLTLDSLQRRHVINGSPLLSRLPGYDWLLSLFGWLSQSISNLAGFISAKQVQFIITGVLFYVIIPLILFRLLGFSFKGQFSVLKSRGAWPILVLYLVLFIINGVNAESVWGLVYCLLYPALCEEFFHRGIFYRSAANIVKNSSAALLVGTAGFCIMHFPDYFFRLYQGNLILVLSNMGDVFLFGLLMAYGYRKTGTLLPWILIHALSNAQYL